ncbi:hypothetical protein [Novipirellula caenicola]|uniref:Secreted protein n=1 Tax=Novipirellula caenicola TaxID=1536901 RepID=A0ABP9VZP8_9BACT
MPHRIAALVVLTVFCSYVTADDCLPESAGNESRQLPANVSANEDPAVVYHGKREIRIESGGAKPTVALSDRRGGAEKFNYYGKREIRVEAIGARATGARRTNKVTAKERPFVYYGTRDISTPGE